MALFLLFRQRAWAEREAAFAAIRGRGEPALFAELPPPAPLAGTGAGPFLRAEYLLGSDVYATRDPSVRRTLAEAIPDLARLQPVAWDRMVVLKADNGIKADPAVAAAVAALRPVRALAAAAVDLEPGRLSRNCDPDAPAGVILSAVQNARQLAHVERLAIQQAAAEGRPRDAWQAALVLLKLERQLREEPFAISFLVRVGLAHYAANAVAELLPAADPTPAELAAVDAVLVRMAGELTLRPALLKERAALIATLDHPDRFSAVTAGSGLARMYMTFYASPLCDARRWSDQAFVARLYGEWLELADNHGEEAAAKAAALARANLAVTSVGLLTRQFLPFVERSHADATGIQARLACLRVALRVHRHRMRTGRLPADLAEVAGPDFALPAGPALGGQPPTFAADATGFTLGSVRKPPPTMRPDAWAVRVTYPNAGSKP